MQLWPGQHLPHQKLGKFVTMKKIVLNGLIPQKWPKFLLSKNFNANYLYDSDIINPEIDFQALGIVLGYL